MYRIVISSCTTITTSHFPGFSTKALTNRAHNTLSFLNITVVNDSELSEYVGGSIQKRDEDEESNSRFTSGSFEPL